MEFEREYGVGVTFEVPMIKAGARDFAGSADWTPAAGDVKVYKDGGVGANITTLPVALDKTWKFTLSATEAQAARIAIVVVDSATKAVEDQQIDIRTFGHPSAADPRDVEVNGTASACTTTECTLPASSDFGANYYPGKRIQVKGTTAATQPQDRMIASTSYATGAYTVTFDRALDTAPTGTISVKVWRQIGPVVSAAVDGNGRVDVGKVAGTAQTAGDLAAMITAVDDLVDTEVAAIKAKTDNLPADPADESLLIAATDAIMTRLGAPAGASVSADVAAVKTDTAAVKTKTDSLAFTVAGKVDANPTAINGDATAAANLAKTTRAIGRGTASGVPTTTSIPTSAFAPASAGAVADQFKGRIVTFDADTTTAALRGQSTDITANTAGAAPAFTVTAMTTAPVSGDTFSVT